MERLYCVRLLVGIGYYQFESEATDPEATKHFVNKYSGAVILPHNPNSNLTES